MIDTPQHVAAYAALQRENQLLDQARSPDTAENFASVCDEIMQVVPPAARPFRIEPWARQGRAKPKIAFYLPSTAILAHTTTLLTALRALDGIGAPIDPYIFSFAPATREFADAFAGIPLRSGNSGDPVKVWLTLQQEGRALDLDAMIHLSSVQGMIFANEIRCARKHIWWSMKWLGHLPGMDGYIKSNGVGRLVVRGIPWDCVYTAFPEMRRSDYAAPAKAERAKLKARTVYGTFARDEKYSREFLGTVLKILERNPDSVFVYGSRKPIAGLPERCLHIGWIDTAFWVQVIDVMLDPFPFPGGYTAYEAIAARTPVVFMKLPPGEQLFAVEEMTNAGWPVRTAANAEEYVEAALAEGVIVAETAESYRKFFDIYLRDEARMATEFMRAISPIL